MVVDLELYENYFLYVNKVVEDVNYINSRAQGYFDRLSQDRGY